MTNISFKRLRGCLTYKFFKSTPFLSPNFQKRLLKTKVAPPAVSAPESSSSFTVQYLVNSCGLPLETALSTSHKLRLLEKNSDRHDSVITFLKSVQFSDEHIEKMIAKRPSLLNCSVETILKPKLQYLMDNGFVGSLLPELIVINPGILFRSLTAHLKPSINLLKTYLETDENIVAAVKRSPALLTFDLKGIMQPNIDFLISQGMPPRSLSKLIITQPRSVVQKLDRIVYAVETVKRLGVKPSAPMFLHSVRVLLSMSDLTWKRKVELLTSYGWSDKDIMSALKRIPLSLACSEEKIKNVMDFYVNTMKLEPAFVAGYPKLLMYAIDTRIRPRYNVLKVLKSKKLLKESKHYAWVFTQTEEDFLNTYVNKHLDEVPNLMELYRGKIMADKFEI